MRAILFPDRGVDILVAPDRFIHGLAWLACQWHELDPILLSPSTSRTAGALAAVPKRRAVWAALLAVGVQRSDIARVHMADKDVVRDRVLPVADEGLVRLLRDAVAVGDPWRVGASDLLAA